jgi:hypothetical protein
MRDMAPVEIACADVLYPLYAWQGRAVHGGKLTEFPGAALGPLNEVAERVSGQILRAGAYWSLLEIAVWLVRPVGNEVFQQTTPGTPYYGAMRGLEIVAESLTESGGVHFEGPIAAPYGLGLVVPANQLAVGDILRMVVRWK